jgi:hypothetical protein
MLFSEGIATVANCVTGFFGGNIAPLDALFI